MIYVGIDPGKSGSVALLNDVGTIVDVLRNEMPLYELATKIASAVRGFHATALIEKVNAMPKQGVSSTFKFGESFGQLQGVIAACGIPCEFVLPRRWQQKMGCLSGGDKNVTKARAMAIWPMQKITHKEADALLIAEYYRRLRTGTLE